MKMMKGTMTNKKGNQYKARSSAMGNNMGRTGPPTMGAMAPWGGMNPKPKGMGGMAC